MPDESPNLELPPVRSRDDCFLRLYNVAYPRIFAFILAVLPNRTDAHDVLQETSLVLLRRFDEFQVASTGPEHEAEAFIRWGCGIARNQVRTLRRVRETVEFSEEMIGRISAAREQHSDLLEMRQQLLRECLAKLPECDRELVARCYQQTITVRQLAEQIHRPANTLYKAMTRIRATLRECIDRGMRRENWA